MKKEQPTKTQIARRRNAKAARAAILASGGSVLYIELDAKHTKLLARKMKATGLTKRDLIQSLLEFNPY